MKSSDLPDVGLQSFWYLKVGYGCVVCVPKTSRQVRSEQV